MNSTTRRLSRNSTDWLLNSQLAPYVGAFTHHFNEGRYASRTVHGHLACIAHFALWMSECRLDIHGVDEDVVQRFLDDHLPRAQVAGLSLLPLSRRAQSAMTSTVSDALAIR